MEVVANIGLNKNKCTYKQTDKNTNLFQVGLVHGLVLFYQDLLKVQDEANPVVIVGYQHAHLIPFVVVKDV